MKFAECLAPGCGLNRCPRSRCVLPSTLSPPDHPPALACIEGSRMTGLEHFCAPVLGARRAAQVQPPGHVSIIFVKDHAGTWAAVVDGVSPACSGLRRPPAG